MNKEMKEFYRELERQGWRLEQGKKAMKAYHPKGGMVSMSLTPRVSMAHKAAARDVQKIKKMHGEA